MKNSQPPTFSTLIGLPGIPKREAQAVNVRSVTDAIRRLRDGHFITTAGSSGALTVWNDSDAMYRCEFDVQGVPQSEKSFEYLAAVHQWLKDWWPRLGRSRNDG